MSRILFNLTAMATMAFVVTILSSVALLLGDPDAPVNTWFNTHGTTVLLIEVGAIVVLGMAAMTADRRETLRKSTASATESADEPGSNTTL
ncbi:MAG: hypothetical protein JSS49_08300 [Planctomycetes bacterium]|nr:hypothetical protein [Planctomycetota bacterium]